MKGVGRAAAALLPKESVCFWHEPEVAASMRCSSRRYGSANFPDLLPMTDR